MPFTLSVIDIHSMDAQKWVPNPFQNVNAIFNTAAVSSQGLKSIKIIIINNKILSSLVIIFIKKNISGLRGQHEYYLIGKMMQSLITIFINTLINNSLLLIRIHRVQYDEHSGCALLCHLLINAVIFDKQHLIITVQTTRLY